MEAYEETGEFPSDVEFVELETDVGWYGRQCRKNIRDQVTFVRNSIVVIALTIHTLLVCIWDKCVFKI